MVKLTLIFSLVLSQWAGAIEDYDKVKIPGLDAAMKNRVFANVAKRQCNYYIRVLSEKTPLPRGHIDPEIYDYFNDIWTSVRKSQPSSKKVQAALLKWAKSPSKNSPLLLESTPLFVVDAVKPYLSFVRSPEDLVDLIQESYANHLELLAETKDLGTRSVPVVISYFGVASERANRKTLDYVLANMVSPASIDIKKSAKLKELVKIRQIFSNPDFAEAAEEIDVKMIQDGIDGVNRVDEDVIDSMKFVPALQSSYLVKKQISQVANEIIEKVKKRWPIEDVAEDEIKSNKTMRDVLKRRILSPDPFTLEELGKIHGMSRERIRQREAKIRRYINTLIERGYHKRILDLLESIED